MYNQYNNYQYSDYDNIYWYQNLLRLRSMYPYKYFYPVCRPVYMNSYENQQPYYANPYAESEFMPQTANIARIRDFGPEPFAIDIEKEAQRNENFRAALWTGSNLQLVLMSLKPGEDVGLEMHPDVDQFVRIEEGHGIVRMGKDESISEFNAEVDDDYIFIVPAGTWHNLINTGSKPLKLYSIYAPPEHLYGTIQKTKADALEEPH